MIFYRRPDLKWRLLQCTIGRAEDAKEFQGLMARAGITRIFTGMVARSKPTDERTSAAHLSLCRKGLL